MAKYLGFYDECDVLDLLKAARKFGAVTVGVYNNDFDEEWFNLSDGEDAIIDLLDGADSDWGFTFVDKEGNKLGTFYVVLGNNDCTAVYDSSAQKWCDLVWDEIG